MDAAELTEWAAYYQMAPFGPERGDLQAALICTVLATIHSGKRFTPQQFMPEFGRDRQPQTAEQMKRALMRATANMGGEIR